MLDAHTLTRYLHLFFVFSIRTNKRACMQIPVWFSCMMMNNVIIRGEERSPIYKKSDRSVKWDLFWMNASAMNGTAIEIAISQKIHSIGYSFSSLRGRGRVGKGTL